MRVSRERVAENRQNILAAAVRLFSEHGFDTVTLDDVMNEAGMTRGAFYGHFSSKNDLVAQACSYAAQPEETETYTLSDYCAEYLTPYHRDNRSGGCPFAALGAEAARQPLETRHQLSEGFKRMIDNLSSSAPGETSAERRVAALSAFSTLVGGLVLARMIDDPTLSDELLAANRKALAERHINRRVTTVP
jgi:TetR/AcrR family transcriptional regulator, transcriptional repressor for nem operon